jgi:hypothetical protein
VLARPGIPQRCTHAFSHSLGRKRTLATCRKAGIANVRDGRKAEPKVFPARLSPNGSATALAGSFILDAANLARNGLAAARFLNRPLGRVHGCHFGIPSLILTRFGSLAATSAWACVT